MFFAPVNICNFQVMRYLNFKEKPKSVKSNMVRI